MIFARSVSESATVYTFNTGLKKRLAALAEKHPDSCRMTVNDAVYGSVTYEIQKSRVSIRLIPPYSEERRKAQVNVQSDTELGVKNRKSKST